MHLPRGNYNTTVMVLQLNKYTHTCIVLHAYMNDDI